ncbi:hypothetical protein TELCIR_02953 [Teladorsagia circumcincta]|uniref:WD domain, G-beta repeat protein n=1 Tax=Teladorsagia circumcincta TaxID=45464 RepID=A0A2G9UXW3_TELCI|nr:hypothetical protein TELCIR_02953 [Teladorsagia circumcincta]
MQQSRKTADMELHFVCVSDLFAVVSDARQTKRAGSDSSTSPPPPRVELEFLRLPRNSKGAIAYGSHSLLFIVDAFTFKRVQTIDLHSTAIDHVTSADFQRQGSQQRAVGAALCPTSEESNVLEYRGSYIDDNLLFTRTLNTTPLGRLGIQQTGFLDALSSGVSCLRMRPIDDLGKEGDDSMDKASFGSAHLVAVGSHSGILHIVDVFSCDVVREFTVQSSPIKSLEWGGTYIVLTAGYNHSLSTAQVVRNDIFATDIRTDNRLYHVVVKGLHVKDGKEVNTQWKSGGWSIRTMAWKDDMLAMGDAEGRVVIWDLGRRQSRHVRASRFPVVRMTFSRLAGDHTLAVLHQRELSLWDTEALTRQHQVTLDSTRSALDMDLCGVSPLLLTNDNVLRYAPGSAKNSPMLEKVSTAGSGDVVDLSGLKNQMLWSRFVGDVAVYNLLAISCSSLSTDDELQLAPDLQMFWPSSSFRERELRVTCAACGAANVEESRLVERAVVAGGKAKERAVDRLIGSTDLRHASMKAALLVSSQECEQARSLIKLIATNLIASDMIEDGVELLFLVKAGGDACKYLQSQRQWNKSIIYAKMGLEDSEDVLSKWITHLSFDQKTQFMYAQASQREWPDVVELLSSVGHSHLARLILRTSTSSPPSSSRGANSPMLNSHGANSPSADNISRTSERSPLE